MGNLAQEIDSYLKRLFPICRSITGDGNRETLRILQEIVPLKVFEVPTGTQLYDWTIPDEWNIREAYIAAPDGRRIVDFRESNLHVVSYSEPVQETFNWPKLKSHLYTHPELPEAIPYRTTYYKRDWGFCVTHAQFHEMEQFHGPFEIFIDSTLEPGALTYGEFLLPGQSEQEILLSCYICHPSMANDNLSGVLLTAFLARHLEKLNKRHWSYRIIFVPETIGAIAYCALNEDVMDRIDMGLVITTVGGPGPFGYKKSWQVDHPINNLIEDTFREVKKKFITYSFDIHGSDERQFSSQSFRINMATISKDRYYEYPQYHSSLDNLFFVTGGQIAETFNIYKSLINKIEARRIYRNCRPNCEVMLSRYGLYPSNGGALKPELGGRSELDLMLWILFLCNGRNALDEISRYLSVSQSAIDKLVLRLSERCILKEV